MRAHEFTNRTKTTARGAGRTASWLRAYTANHRLEVHFSINEHLIASSRPNAQAGQPRNVVGI